MSFMHTPLIEHDFPALQSLAVAHSGAGSGFATQAPARHVECAGHSLSDRQSTPEIRPVCGAPEQPANVAAMTSNETEPSRRDDERDKTEDSWFER
jgi:hypothetical protein